MNNLPLPRWIPAAIVSILAGGAFLPCASSGADILKTGSRTPFHHVIPLRDLQGNMITMPPAFDEEGKPQDAIGQPFSTSQTCGTCHEYSAISEGWHFNAGRTNVPSGRPGEPWILTDPATRTQLPLSYRGWTGTFKPADVGLSDYDFLVAFARHFPGGGVGQPPVDQIQTNDVRMRRFLVTGPMEIDCLICHTRTGDYDHEARFKALSTENFKWSATIASELGTLRPGRTGKAIADSWRPPRPVPTNTPPIRYNRNKIDAGNHATFHVTRRPPVENCYYCHTSMSHLGDTRWHSDGDVHIRAGMTCVDCHRNGIDHHIVRGYEGESTERPITEGMLAVRAERLLRDDLSLSEEAARNLAAVQLKEEFRKVETLTCQGCHYGTSDQAMAGRLGAPHPEHKGIPPIHFEKMTCTACHSGPIPDQTMDVVHTSLAHKLGLPGPERGANTAPVIIQPVFIENTQGKIAPHKMVWPSYWGYLNEGKITPLLPEQVSRVAGEKFPRQTTEEMKRDPYNTRPLADDQIREVLTALGGSTNGQPVFIAAGKMHRLNGENLTSEEHEAAKAYAWPVGHDVRPASQSLGVKGCADCHADDSPIYFASVTSRGPVGTNHLVSTTQWSLRGGDEAVISTFAYTFYLRPLLKIITFSCAIIVFFAVVGRVLSYFGGSSVSR